MNAHCSPGGPRRAVPGAARTRRVIGASLGCGGHAWLRLAACSVRDHVAVPHRARGSGADSRPHARADRHAGRLRGHPPRGAGRGEPRWNYRGPGPERRLLRSSASGRLVYSRLYRYDATRQRDPGPGRRTLPCPAPTPGHPLPARRDDVPRRDAAHGRRRRVHVPASLPVPDWCEYWVRCTIEEVRVVDPRTVDFVLSSVDPTFLDPRRANFADLLPARASRPRTPPSRRRPRISPRTGVADARRRDRRGARRRSPDLQRRPPRPGRTPSSTARRAPLPRRTTGPPPGRSTRAAYLAVASRTSSSSRSPRRSVETGLDGGDAGARLSLSTCPAPRRHRPLSLVSEDADGIHLEAFAGLPRRAGGDALRRLRARPRPTARTLVDGTVDILRRAPGARQPPPAAAARAGVARCRHASTPVLAPSPSTSGRGACSPTSTSGGRSSSASTCRATSTPRPVEPGPDLQPGPGRAAGPTTPTCRSRPARRRRRGASSRAPGWTLGADGVYAKGRASALPPNRRPRGDAADRVKMADLIALQAARLRDGPPEQPCRLRRTIDEDLLTYPHASRARRRRSTSTSAATGTPARTRRTRSPGIYLCSKSATRRTRTAATSAGSATRPSTGCSRRRRHLRPGRAGQPLPAGAGGAGRAAADDLPVRPQRATTRFARRSRPSTARST